MTLRCDYCPNFEDREVFLVVAKGQEYAHVCSNLPCFAAFGRQLKADRARRKTATR